MSNYCDSLTHTVIPTTVGQYTSRTGKNGVRIFEGDVVRYLTDYHDKANAEAYLANVKSDYPNAFIKVM
jgi:uncharacterized phage protein (TIGR01671 family)